jgi:hypothetical protein
MQLVANMASAVIAALPAQVVMSLQELFPVSSHKKYFTLPGYDAEKDWTVVMLIVAEGMQALQGITQHITTTFPASNSVNKSQFTLLQSLQLKLVANCCAGNTKVKIGMKRRRNNFFIAVELSVTK